MCTKEGRPLNAGVEREPTMKKGAGKGGFQKVTAGPLRRDVSPNQRENPGTQGRNGDASGLRGEGA